MNFIAGWEGIEKMLSQLKKFSTFSAASMSEVRCGGQMDERCPSVGMQHTVYACRQCFKHLCFEALRMRFHKLNASLKISECFSAAQETLCNSNHELLQKLPAKIFSNFLKGTHDGNLRWGYGTFHCKIFICCYFDHWLNLFRYFCIKWRSTEEPLRSRQNFRLSAYSSQVVLNVLGGLSTWTMKACCSRMFNCGHRLLQHNYDKSTLF